MGVDAVAGTAVAATMTGASESSVGADVASATVIGVGEVPGLATGAPTVPQSYLNSR